MKNAHTNGTGKIVGTKRDTMSKLFMNIQEPHTETLKMCTSRSFTAPSITYNVCKWIFFKKRKSNYFANKIMKANS